MVNPMCGRRVEDIFRPAQYGNPGCMQPELVQKIERQSGYDSDWTTYGTVDKPDLALVSDRFQHNPDAR